MLPGFIINSKACTGRDADRSVKICDTVFHEDVKDAGGEDASHRAALHDESGLSVHVIPLHVAARWMGLSVS